MGREVLVQDNWFELREKDGKSSRVYGGADNGICKGELEPSSTGELWFKHGSARWQLYKVGSTALF